jgi:hypothetical protein
VSDTESAGPLVEVEEVDPELEAFRKAIATGELEVEVDGAAIGRRIASEIMDSPDLEAAFADKPTWSARDVIGYAFELRGLHLNLSQYDKGSPVYAAVDAVDLNTGEVGVLNTSAAKHLAKLYVMERDHRFPVRVRISQSARPTAAGYYPLDFELVQEQEG